MAQDAAFKVLRHFTKHEFKHPEMMDESFLLFLDKARELAGVPFKLNSDGRTVASNSAASGHSKRSSHLLGRAVDVDIQLNDYSTITRILTGVMKAAIYFNVVNKLGLETVNTPSDSHIHIDLGGTFPDGFVIQRPWIALRPD
jgi:uncharacterized protein YcbK (DUF882 family)